LRKSELKVVDIDSSELIGKVAVVFGGSYGIGEAISNQLKVKGAIVFQFSRSLNGVDVGIKDQVSTAFKEVYKATGKIDYVINTAGLLHKEPLVTADYQTICDAVQTNYMGTLHVALESFSFLRESKGKLLFFTSSSYTRGRAFYSIYSSTKAAIVNFVQAIAQEWEPFGIGVNCINPERTNTPMRVRSFGVEPEESLLTAERVAQLSIQSLLSEFTGQVIDVKREEK
ncbi:MAG: SDR family NAD(P)-dependent oxidoreductase, partial [Phocaeicola sp.]